MFFFVNPVTASAFTSGTIKGTSGSRRKWEELSITLQPALAAFGANSSDTEPPAATSASADGLVLGVATDCETIAGLFAAGPSVNPNLADPESSATCDGDVVTVTANGIPDYTYIETSPGQPRVQDISVEIPVTPVPAAEVTAVPLLGSLGVTLTGVPIYGATEGTGGDVLSLGGALSECGSHNGPTGFHIHIVDTSENTDCLFTPAEVLAAPQLVGYAFDGYPIYTGNDQFTSSWELTDETLFASDTWSAHSYVEGLGDLDECNGRFDDAGNYAYFTTDTFPYTLGCFAGEVAEGLAAGGGGGGPGAPAGGGEGRAPRRGEGGPETPPAGGDG